MALRTTQVILKYTGAKVIALAMNLIVRNWEGAGRLLARLAAADEGPDVAATQGGRVHW